MTTAWDELLRLVEKHECPCGSGGPLACDDDCPGDQRPVSVLVALRALIIAVQALEARPRRAAGPMDPEEL